MILLLPPAFVPCRKTTAEADVEGVLGGSERHKKEKSPAEPVLPNATQKLTSLIHHTITTHTPLMEVNRWRDENGSSDVTPMIERERVLIYGRFGCSEKLAKQVEYGGVG